ncbi:hypothetical protein D0Z07_9142 [Hyphodiscus hymeniophilus]|uniref:Uncharacterized protein n=1 Tax=Hyphodiscus hymeniophilus TaxID=353542 RepID=A0A9P6VC52_9HELO|nr:hypothetical protein D0Z07_9142 [Hyphodiscus hymeniophilus]
MKTNSDLFSYLYLVAAMEYVKTSLLSYISLLMATLQFVSQIPPYFANTQGASDAEGGVRTIPASIGNAVGALIAGQVIKKFGSYKQLSIVSLFLSIGTCILILFQWSRPIGPWESLTTLPYGLFAGIVLSTQFIGLYHCAPKENMATAISMYYMSQQIGIAVGISLCSSLLKRQFRTTLTKTLVAIPGYEKVTQICEPLSAEEIMSKFSWQQIIRSILTDSSVVALLPSNVRLQVWQSYLSSFWVVSGMLLRLVIYLCHPGSQMIDVRLALVIAAQVVALLPMVSTSEKYSQ